MTQGRNKLGTSRLVPPSNWDSLTLKRLGRLLGGSGFPHDYQGSQVGEIGFFKVGDLARSADGRVMPRAQHRVSQEVAAALGAHVVPARSVVWAKIGAALLLNRRRITTEACCIDNNMTAFVPDAAAVVPEWIYYWMDTVDFGEYVNPGAVPSLSEGSQGEIPILLPPPEVQHEIVALLDQETARIDELVREQERLKGLLVEKYQALVTQAVAPGFGLETGSKRSGGLLRQDASRHQWVESRLSRFVTVSNTIVDVGTMRETDVFHYSIPSVQQKGGGAREDGVTISSSKIKIVAPSVLVSKLNPRKGTVCIATPHDVLTVCSTEFVPLVPRGISIKYLYYLMISEANRQRLAALVESATRSHERVDPVEIYKSVWPVPPLHKQHEIVIFLDEETERLATLLALQDKSISLLLERRSALITAAVTGHIDVRDWHAPSQLRTD